MNATRPAVFVIDMVNDSFGHAELDRRREQLCSSINALTAWSRENKLPVVWVRQEFEPDLSDAFLDMKRENIRMYIKGTPGVRILGELVRHDSDIDIIKKRYSMFYGTDLESLLTRLGIDSIILAGVNTHACIRTAAIDAYQRDLFVTIVRDCVASKDLEHHTMTLEYLGSAIASVMTLSELRAQLAETAEHVPQF
jgi:nicotinamidase-related amidase